MKIAVEGCAHGALDSIYATLQHLERAEQIKIDLLICCGDFQAVRNQEDLESLACPPKYRAMNSFWKYYSGEKVAPYPTVFVGGNHEASNYLWELYYGGWAARNIYFLGAAGVINFGGLRIGGLSGIYSSHDYHSGHYERVPYDHHDIRSIYHVRSYDVHKLMRIEEKIDVFVSHDWPRGISKFGDQQELLRNKPFFQRDVENNTLGSLPAEQLLNKLKPACWFSAHLHVKFSAVVPHSSGSFTRFLALDKCLPRRDFLQVLDFPEANGALEFTYDEEWLAITRAYDPHFPLSRHSSGRPWETITREELRGHRQWLQQRLQEKGNVIPNDFSITAPPHNPNQGRQNRPALKVHYRNPHTEDFLKLLELPYKLESTPHVGSRMANRGHSALELTGDPNEIVLAEEENLDDQGPIANSAVDPNEVPLDDDDSETM